MAMEQQAFPETAQIQARWRQLASGFCQASSLASEWSRAAEDLLIAKLEEHSPRQIVDIGCGVGDPTLRLAAEHARAQVVGVDFVEEMLVEVRRRARAANLSNVETVCADMLRLPFGNASVDAVTSRFGIQYYDDGIKRRILEEAARVLRPGGALVIVDWGAEGHGPLKEFYMKVFRDYPETTRANDAATPFALKTDSEFATLLGQAGFRNVEHGYPEVRWVWQGTAAALWDLVVALAPQLTQLLASLPGRLASEVNQRILDGLGEYVVGTTVVIPVRHVLLSGVR